MLATVCAEKKFGEFLFSRRYAVPRPLSAFLALLKRVTYMILLAVVSSYCELRFVQKRNFVNFYFRDVIQFPVL